MSIPGQHPRADYYRTLPDHPHIAAGQWEHHARDCLTRRADAHTADPADGTIRSKRTAWLAAYYYCAAQAARLDDDQDRWDRMAGSFDMALNLNLIDDPTAGILDEITAPPDSTPQ